MSNQTKAIVVQSQGAGFQIVIPTEALKIKDAALAKTCHIVKVTNAEEQTDAIQAASIVKGVLSETEATRKQVKQPYWDACKLIDLRAAEFVKELDAEAKRLEKLVADFQREQQRRIELQRRQAEEAQREAARAVERERARLAEIERQKLLAEQQAAAAKTKKAREAAAVEAARLKAEQEQAEIDAMEAQDDAEAAASVVVEQAPAAKGSSVTFVREFEVTDYDALYAFDLARRKALAERNNIPLSMVSSWISMEAKKREIKEFILALSEDQLDSIPGLSITNTARAAVKGVPSAISFQ